MWAFVWLAICIPVFLYFIVGCITKYNSRKKIPGPKGKFIVGNSLEFYNKRRVPLFYYFRYLANKCKDAFELRFGSKKFVFIYNPKDIEALITSTKYNVMGNTTGYAYTFLRPWLRDGLLLSNGKKWQHRRKILTPTFHFNVLRNFNSVLIDQSAKLVESLRSELNHSKTNCYPFLTSFALNSICETAMGTALDEESFNISKHYNDTIHKLGLCIIQRFSKLWLHPDVIFNMSYIGRRQKRLLQLITTFRDCVITKRRQNGNLKFFNTESINQNDEDDVLLNDKKPLTLLDVLLVAEQQGIIDAAGINEEIDTFMFEGHETTATALHFAFMLLANNPDVQDKIIEEYSKIFGSPDQRPTFNDLKEMKYLEACIKESLRLYPPVHFIEKRIGYPVKINNIASQPGSSYIIALYDLHRRCDQFVEPLEFRPDRFLKDPTWHAFAYMPFSAGKKNCIGQKFAMMEMKLAISAVLSKYRLLPVTKPQDIIFIVDIILRTKDPIYVKFVER